MATTGAKLPTAAPTAAEDPWLDNDWVNAANVYGAGEAEVSAATFDAGDQTYVLKARGFDFSAIPNGSTINGVTCMVTGRYATAAASIDLLQLLDATGAKVGTNQAATPIALSTSSTPYTKGGAADTWGNALDSAWVKNANFGVALGCLAGGTGNNNVDVYIDLVTLEIDYTPPATIDYTETVNNSVGLSGAPANSHGWVRALAGSLSLTGTPAPVRGYRRSVEQALGLTDAAAALRGALRVVAEALGIVDSFKRQSGLRAGWKINVTIGG